MLVFRYALGSTLVTLVLGAGYLWWTLLSPFTYERPADLPPIPAGDHQVFVYGTLMHAPVRWLVYGRAGDPQPASLPGFRQQALDLESAPSHRVKGLLLSVDEEELAQLDRYERLGYRYERVRIRASHGDEVWVYRRL